MPPPTTHKSSEQSEIVDTSLVNNFSGYRPRSNQLESKEKLVNRSDSELDNLRKNYLNLYDIVPIGIGTLNEFGLIVGSNLSAGIMLDTLHSELIQKPILDFIFSEDRAIFSSLFNKLIKGENRDRFNCDLRFIKKNGVLFFIRINAILLLNPNVAPSIEIALSNITDAKLAEAALSDSNNFVETLIKYDYGPIVIWNTNLIILKVNHAFELLTGLRSKDILGKSLADFATADHRGMANELILQTLSLKRLEKQYINIKHKNNSVRIVEWTSAYVKDQVDSSIKFIIAHGEEVTEREISKIKIKQQIKELHEAFLSTVELANNMSAVRDPYTSEHARRVSQIAVAISIELGFDEDQQEALRIAGILHDIGKISVPSDILNKPNKISPIEYILLQQHAQKGFELLKKVSFPWLGVALVAQQHHERIDGSGYPLGLKGEEISLNARIVAVADVVEAMSSHRPYRAARGIQVALETIENGRGTLFDAHIVDVCLKLFRDEGYKIPD